jgi:hypothetical protein
MPTDQFIYDSLLVRYDAESGRYHLVDINYVCEIAALVLEDGPGWVVRPNATFFDVGEIATILELLSALNKELV